MKLAVSNIAWTNEEEPEVAVLLERLGVQYVEIAPTKRWQDPTTEATVEAIAEYKAFWQSYGIEIVAFQSMLFNRPDLKIFDSEELRQETLQYLQDFIALAPMFGARVMVFGSPKNRQRGQFSDAAVNQIAQSFFTALGKAARQHDTLFCIEPNPIAYACDFVVNAAEGQAFVKQVATPGFGLHLDIAGMTLAGDDVVASIREAGDVIEHFHISAPSLDQVYDRDDVDYRGAAEALRGISYDKFVSIEMRPGAAGENVSRVETAVRFAQSVFGD